MLRSLQRGLQIFVSDTMPYVTLFEITQESLPLWIPFFPVIFGLFGAIFFLLTRGVSDSFSKLVRYFMLLFACLWVIVVVYHVRNRRHYVQAYQNGKYSLVEGPVEHYSWKGKTECFSLRGVEFCHGTANQVGWQPPLRLGPSSWPVGLIRQGLPVRVAYSDDQPPQSPLILRLEIGSNSR